MELSPENYEELNLLINIRSHVFVLLLLFCGKNANLPAYTFETRYETFVKSDLSFGCSNLFFVGLNNRLDNVFLREERKSFGKVSKLAVLLRNRLFKFENGQFLAGWKTNTQFHLCIFLWKNWKFPNIFCLKKIFCLIWISSSSGTSDQQFLRDCSVSSVSFFTSLRSIFSLVSTFLSVEKRDRPL